MNLRVFGGDAGDAGDVAGGVKGGFKDSSGYGAAVVGGRSRVYGLSGITRTVGG